MALFKPVELANTSQVNAAAQTGSANRVLDATNSPAAKATLDKKFNQNTRNEGRGNADFWQGSKQNLSGLRNVANGANRGADMGQAFSVMQGAGDAQSLNANVNRDVNAASKSVNDYGFSQKVSTAANAQQQAMDIHKTQTNIEANNGTLNAIADGLNGAVSGYMGGTEFKKAGGFAGIKDKLSTVGNNFKEGFKGQNDLWNGLVNTARLNDKSFNPKKPGGQ